MNSTGILAKLYNSNSIDREAVILEIEDISELFSSNYPIKMDNGYFLKEKETNQKPSEEVMVSICKGLIEDWGISKDKLVIEFEGNLYTNRTVCFKSNNVWN